LGMWIRRLGVPPLWPSRVKVLFLGLLASCFILSVYQYLAGASAEYLRLAEPSSLDITCRLPTEECQGIPNPAECMDEHTWVSSMVLSGLCPRMPASLRGQTCLNLSLPVFELAGSLGRLRTTKDGMNPFKLWSVLFAVLMSLLALSIITHDLALLDDSEHQIFTMAEVCDQSPGMRRYIQCLRCRRHTGSRIYSLYRSAVCLPCWVVLQVVAFVFVVYPYSLVFFVRRPVRMSRMMVFLSSVLCTVWSLSFVVLSATIYKSESYALLWSYASWDSPNCVCFCEYPLRRDVTFRMVCMGLGVLAHSSSLAFRALKGLRRSQWANLFSVLYSVPIAAFPVAWTRPPEAGGGPIRHRSEGEPAQGEPAFDPFCLMDEQPESAFTRIRIAPEPRPGQLQAYVESLKQDLGACGFPHFLASGRQSVKEPLLRS